MKISISQFLILCYAIIPFIFTSCCEDGFRTEIRTLQKDQWIGMLNSTFSDVSLKLNNYTPNDHEFFPDDERAFYKSNDSFLSLDALGISLTFDIPVQRNDPYSSYVNDINSTSFTPDTRGSQALVTIQFESEDKEIIGNCVDNVFCFCGDPKIDLNDMKIDVLMTLEAEDGDLSIAEIDALLSSTFEEEGPCVDNACAFACDIFAPDREGQIKTAIETAISGYFTANKVLVEQIFNAHINNLGITEEISAVSITERGDLLLTLKFPDESCV